MTGLKLKVKTVNKVVLLKVSLIYPNPAQPRKIFDMNELSNLAQSIQKNGLLQPLTVRSKGRYYELISGERRLRALKLAKIEEAPCIIMDTTEQQAAVFGLLENIQRSDLNYFEEAAALQKLTAEWGVSQQELGTRLGMAQSTIANKQRLLRFNEKTRRLILDKGLNERQARSLLRLKEEKQVLDAIHYITKNQLNASQTEHYIDSLLTVSAKPHRSFRPVVKDVRLFLNTINRAISVMNQSGIPASSEKIEKDGCIEYIVKIPLQD